MTHFTYRESDGRDLSQDDLCQGDLLERSVALGKILKDFFPHYHSEDDCRYFIILTQSCDLVRRNNAPCKSKYITLAPVRPMRMALEEEVHKYQYHPIEKKLGFISESNRHKIIQFMQRLFNNNESDYFFLFREPELGLEGDFCAFLQQPISVRAEDHYDVLLKARILQLQESFQHKLGYWVGILYSRVGTADWVPDNYTEEDFKRFTEEPVKKDDLVRWLDDRTHRRVLRDLIKK
ncbi:MAG: hypothetical protein HQK59_09265 [Deltaproteobacteria bacterium]|nr:hypothetical protein [Deltaproteobacteria bacterium]